MSQGLFSRQNHRSTPPRKREFFLSCSLCTFLHIPLHLELSAFRSAAPNPDHIRLAQEWGWGPSSDIPQLVLFIKLRQLLGKNPTWG